jgi:CheY-like chemotaxis protein
MLGKKILIVEDEAMLADVMRDELVNAGFDVSVARDGQEGLAMAQSVHPDLMMVDVLMPKMDGISMLKNLRANPEFAKIPASVLTNLNDSQTIQDALESGAYDFLVKSNWNPKDLVKYVKEKLGIT